MRTNLKVKLEERGVRAAIARHFDISQQAVDQWLYNGSIPAERVLGVEAVTGIPRHDIRPDLYPMEAA